MERKVPTCFYFTAVDVGFESSAYTVRENAGSVEVCVTIASQHNGCPVQYNFSLVLVGLPGSAG